VAATGGAGVASGLFGIGGGALLVPLLVLVFRFEQHRAQGTSLLALVPPTGLLAFLNYWHAGKVDWKVGLLLIPGVFLGGILGSKWAHKLSPPGMRRVFAALLFALGAWQAVSSWVG
jgi:uncharacterized membrane protein YfcA